MNVAELNQLVYEKVLGTDQEKVTKGNELFSPATNIADAWAVLDYVCETHNWRAILDRNQDYTEVTFKSQMGGWITYFGTAETPSLAICVATLETAGMEMGDNFEVTE